jgi:hypothetical protein
MCSQSDEPNSFCIMEVIMQSSCVGLMLCVVVHISWAVDSGIVSANYHESRNENYAPIGGNEVLRKAVLIWV